MQINRINFSAKLFWGFLSNQQTTITLDNLKLTHARVFLSMTAEEIKHLVHIS